MAASKRRAAPSRARRSTRRTASESAPQESRGFWNYPRREHTGLHRWLPSWRVVLGTFIGGMFLVLGAGAAAFAFIDPPSPLAEAKFETTTVYFAGDQPGQPGPVMGTFAEQRREIVDYGTLPAHIGQAVAAGEDKTFFTNRGVSITGMARAFINNIQGKPTQGGSTLTQQYVERYYQNTTTDYLGKAKEAILAIKIAQSESKEEIMGRYLNTIYFGRDSYGIQAAAKSYFGKNAAELTVSEAAMLAALIPSPNNWDPAVAPEKSQQRWGLVLDSMVDSGWLSAEERAAQTFPATIPFQQSETYRGPNGFLLEMVENELLATKMWTAGELRTRGLDIITTIDPAVQHMAVESAEALRAGQLSDGEPPNERLRVSVVSVDPATGGIVALYGGPDYLTDAKNTATFDEIQAGSTFKPFTLVTALQQGISLSKKYDGSSPQRFPEWDGGKVDVQNYGNKGAGTIDLVEATADSVNTVYAALNIEVGPENTAKTAEAAGITTPLTTVPSNVLGSDHVRPLDMAGAYATFAAQGVRRTPHILQVVLDNDDQVAWQPDTTGTNAFPADVMADATYAMTQVVERGSGKAQINKLDRPIAGKTGTSSFNKSAWFVGYVPQLATAVALSQQGQDGKSLDSIKEWGDYREITGSSYPAVLWADYMGKVFTHPKYQEVQDFPARANIGGKATPTPTQTETATPEPTPEEPAQPADVQVPGGLVNRTEADASGVLQGAGLVAAVVTEQSQTVPKGRVIRAEPGEGATLPAGSTVTLVVSSGPPPPPQPSPTPAPSTSPSAPPVEPPGGGEDAGGGA
ncbi:penicillin-binding protein [Cellulomonas wangsupingiae]|uniref:penicillin-binding protein n=1 Tax=Cellulomonas wangsupingiae TaxID=2968085 RepID=UPI001D0E57A6|nr:penicillin-binding protein [Cellulomonas wangsupingiae]MCM0639286.1 penicillin-binding protein [Cellulomonas wangsupingiae]